MRLPGDDGESLADLMADDGKEDGGMRKWLTAARRALIQLVVRRDPQEAKRYLVIAWRARRNRRVSEQRELRSMRAHLVRIMMGLCFAAGYLLGVIVMALNLPTIWLGPVLAVVVLLWILLKTTGRGE